MAAHAKLGASNAHMWLACPPSANINYNAGERTSDYAEEGTLAHELCELEVKKFFGIPQEMKPASYRKAMKDIKSHRLWDADMVDCADLYLNEVKSVALKCPERPFMVVEQKVDYSTFVPNGFGTVDCLIIAGDTLHVFDYKHGRGVSVDVVDNPQMKLYALGALQMFGMFYPITKAVLHIVQPRISNIDHWEVSVADLNTWAETVVRPTAELADAGLGEYNPGEKQCKWCAINGICDAQAKKAYALAKSELYQKPGAAIDDASIGDLITLTREISAWAKKLEDHAKAKLLEGQDIKGFKMVSGRSSRDWSDMASAFAAFESAGVVADLLWERVPLSVAKVEKVVDKKTFAQIAPQFINKKEGAPTLVPDSDKRAKYVPAEQDFKDFIKEA